MLEEEEGEKATNANGSLYILLTQLQNAESSVLDKLYCAFLSPAGRWWVFPAITGCLSYLCLNGTKFNPTLSSLLVCCEKNKNFHQLETNKEKEVLRQLWPPNSLKGQIRPWI